MMVEDRYRHYVGRSRPVICSWTQVDSCLREIAESQIAVQEMEASSYRRFKQDAIEYTKGHADALKKGLTIFVLEHRRDMPTNEQVFPFGKVKIEGEEVVIELNIAEATLRRGKP
jgi:hypothetical protein